VRRGLVVRPIPEEQILEVFAVWGALDQLAARLAVEHSTLPDRSRMIWLNERIKIASDRLEQANLPDLNMRFHMALCEAAHNSVLLQVVRQIHYSVVRFGNDVQRAWSRLGCHRRTFRHHGGNRSRATPRPPVGRPPNTSTARGMRELR